MQTLANRPAQCLHRSDNIIDLSEYRQRILELQQPASALPPLSRRTHHRPSFLLPLSDLLSISGAAAVLGLTVMVLSRM